MPGPKRGGGGGCPPEGKPQFSAPQWWVGWWTRGGSGGGSNGGGLRTRVPPPPKTILKINNIIRDRWGPSPLSLFSIFLSIVSWGRYKIFYYMAYQQYSFFNLISRLNNKEQLILLNSGEISKKIIFILDYLKSKGYISFSYNPFYKQIFIQDNKIKKIVVKSKPSRKIFVKKEPYKLSLGNFITNNNQDLSKNQLLELYVYVE
jgi:hypothetical protein